MRVQRLDVLLCRWTFSEAVLSVGHPSGLRTSGGGAGESVEQESETELLVDYGSDVQGGDTWNVVPAEIDITFESGGTLSPQSGVIE